MPAHLLALVAGSRAVAVQARVAGTAGQYLVTPRWLLHGKTIAVATCSGMPITRLSKHDQASAGACCRTDSTPLLRCISSTVLRPGPPTQSDSPPCRACLQTPDWPRYQPGEQAMALPFLHCAVPGGHFTHRPAWRPYPESHLGRGRGCLKAEGSFACTVGAARHRGAGPCLPCSSQLDRPPGL